MTEPATQPDAPPTAKPRRVGIVTLGCDKNTVDNEYLAGCLEQAGWEVVPIGESYGGPALDAAVVTTCGFIGPAKEQSVDAIVALAERKRELGDPARLFVAGCLSQRYGEELMSEIPEIDGLVGVGQFARLSEWIDGPAAGRTRETSTTPTVDIYKLMHRRRLEATPHAFLKIADGCNHNCTFCSIPLMKGRLRSVAPEILLAEARELLDQGVRELNLVAQDLSDYGRDRGGPARLPELLRQLAALEGDFWIRCLYFYPGQVTDSFIDVLASEPKIVPYLDMPLQHLDPGVLRRMKRPFHAVNTFELVNRLRARVPGLTLRTTMIVGFPGETDAEHAAMLEGMRALRFDRLGAFRYSEEDDTPAGTMAAQVPESVREARWHAVMRTQAGIAEELNAARVGERARVLIEGHDAASGRWFGRSPAEAPEIDGKVYVESARPLRVGEFVGVTISAADTYDVEAMIEE